MTSYVARVDPGLVGVYHVDDDHEVLIATIPLPDRASLRHTLLDEGWRLTGRKARGGWRAILVTPAEARPHPI